MDTSFCASHLLTCSVLHLYISHDSGGVKWMDRVLRKYGAKVPEGSCMGSRDIPLDTRVLGCVALLVMIRPRWLQELGDLLALPNADARQEALTQWEARWLVALEARQVVTPELLEDARVDLLGLVDARVQ